MDKILLTGASGFIGSALLERLLADGQSVTGTARKKLVFPFDLVIVGEIGPETRWLDVVKGHQTVVHTAARVHVMHDSASDPLSEFRRVNVEGTLNLARQAAAAGVRRFVFISSIKVNGEETAPGQLFRDDDLPHPLDPYGLSKQEAEEGLRQIAQESGMEVVIIRPPLVYGPGVKANFETMMRWLHRGLPLPLGSIRNRRSLVALDNLVDLIVACIDHPAAANQTFLVSDGEDLSTTELLQRMGAALGKPARLLPVPSALLSAGATVLGKRAVAQRLLGSLQVDMSKTQELLDWTPPVRVDDALRKTAEHFLADQG